MIGNVPQRAQEPLCDAGEYVVECHSYKGKTYPHSGPQRVHERVVRCRDCYWCAESMAGAGALECDYINRGVDPDGFCAWGELRED